MISYALARYLHAAGVAVLGEDLPAGNLFIEHLPKSPDLAVSIRTTGGDPIMGSWWLGDDQPTVQVIVRGAPDDPVTPHALALHVYDHLMGLRNTTLDSGGTHQVYVYLCRSMQTEPAQLGQDDARRYSYSLNFQLRITRTTTNRAGQTIGKVLAAQTTVQVHSGGQWLTVEGVLDVAHGSRQISEDTQGIGAYQQNTLYSNDADEWWDVQAFRLENASTGARDDGQQAIEAAARTMGKGPQVKLTTPGNHAFTFYAIPEVAELAGQLDGFALWKVRLYVSGEYVSRT